MVLGQPWGQRPWWGGVWLEGGRTEKRAKNSWPWTMVR